MMRGGVEGGWLVVGQVFGEREGYAKLVARIVVEFEGWEGGREGVIVKRGVDGKKVVLGGWVQPDVLTHMRSEQARLKREITARMGAWYSHLRHLQIKKKAICTCSSEEDCVEVADELADELRKEGLVRGGYKGSILGMRLLLQRRVEEKLGGGWWTGAAGRGTCRVRDSMIKLVREVDEVLEGVRGITFAGKGEEGRVEVFGVRELCGRDLVLPLTIRQLGTGAFFVALVVLMVEVVLWGGVKMLLRGAAWADNALR
ncbi:hypothetical protein TWF730_003700 [Orbilia blumenaviensis]|uniref:Uncharacterized protein n=1 Tax=Orbilia blumenaviensis TaxID=1796055 RepID=A0AAV9U347_9PEZI